MSGERSDFDRVAGAIFGCALGYAAGLAAGGAPPTFDRNVSSIDQAVQQMRFLRAHQNGAAGQSPPSLSEMPVRCGQNLAVARTTPCAFTDWPAAWAAYFCRASQPEARCVAACIAQASLIRELADTPAGEPVDSASLRRAMEAAVGGLEREQRKSVMKWAMRSARLGTLKLRGRGGDSASAAPDHALRVFGCSLWAFRCLYQARARERGPEFFRRIVTRIAQAGGDAPANASAAGALLGAAVGYRALPEDLVDAVPHRALLMADIALWYASWLFPKDD